MHDCTAALSRGLSASVEAKTLPRESVNTSTPKSAVVQKSLIMGCKCGGRSASRIAP